MRSLLRLLPRRHACLAVLLGASAVLAGAALLSTSGALITASSLHPDSLLVLLPLITAVRLFAVSRATLRYAERLVSHDLTLRLVGRLRTDLLEKMLPLAPGALVGVRGGDLLARVRTDVDELQGVFVRLVAPAAVAVLAGGVAVGLTALVSPGTSLVLALLLLGLGVAVPLWSQRVGAEAAVAAAREDAAVGTEVLDLVRGLTDHLSSDGGRTALATLDNHLARQAAAERRTARLTATTTLTREGVPALGVVSALWLVGWSVTNGQTNPVLLAAAALGVLGAFESVSGLGQAWSSAGRLRAAAARVEQLGRKMPAVSEPAQPRPLPRDQALVLEHVTLTYPGAERPALRDFSLRVSPGEHVALTGPSGAGKSSVLALILRSYDPDGGRLLLGDVDLREVALTSLRSRSAWAPQSPQLLGGSIAANLRIARPSASVSQLEAALGSVGLDDLLGGVGLDGWIGEAGSRLSAGERARVAIARALLSPAPLLLLDEPTAHLDQASATRLLDQLAADPRTVLLVTHSAESLDRRWRVVEMPGTTGP